MEKLIAKSYARLIRAGRRTLDDVPDGVIDALRQAGCGEGDTVRIGALEFDFID